MSKEQQAFVWAFNGARSQFASGIFSSLGSAVEWIARHRLTGVLTKYPLNEGFYDWALRMNFFSPKREDQKTPEFIGRFTCAQEHYHFEDGAAETEIP